MEMWNFVGIYVYWYYKNMICFIMFYRIGVFFGGGGDMMGGFGVVLGGGGGFGSSGLDMVVMV